MKSIEIVNLKNRNITYIPQSLIQEIGCFVKVSTYKYLRLSNYNISDITICIGQNGRSIYMAI